MYVRCKYFCLRLTRCFFIQIFLRIQLKIHAILRDGLLIITKGWGGGGGGLSWCLVYQQTQQKTYPLQICSFKKVKLRQASNRGRQKYPPKYVLHKKWTPPHLLLSRPCHLSVHLNGNQQETRNSGPNKDETAVHGYGPTFVGSCLVWAVSQSHLFCIVSALQLYL